METALLRLFNGVHVSEKVKPESDFNEAVLKRTLKNGYVLDPVIEPYDKLLDIIEKVIGISGEKANSAFHKNWKTIQEASDEELIIQQIIHYFTTYGFEALGIYREDAVYIPNEVLEVPEVEEDIPLAVVKAMTKDDILEAVVDLGGAGIALAQETLDDLMVIIVKCNFSSDFVKTVENRELKAMLHDHYGIVPSEPVEFLRYLINKLTSESLLIKNKQLIDKIKESNGRLLDELIEKAPSGLASIFFRFKPLLLAMKHISSNKRFFNRLRKDANTMHKPMPKDFLNSVTADIKRDSLKLQELKSKIEKATIFRKIRLAYALNYRLSMPDSIVYQIRNGRGWATDFEWAEEFNNTTEDALNIVINSIANDIKKDVEGKTVFIPSNVNYTLPATEKQFTGNFPTGSYISVDKDLIVGIHWFNTDKRVDLDLSVISEAGKIGWDADYRSKERDVLFSGDITDARKPHGATELFYIKQGKDQKTKIMIANYYNFHRGDEVVCKILVAKEHPKNFSKNYMVDVNNISAQANVNISKKQNILALICNVAGENRVYFTNVSVGSTITAKSNAQSTHVRRYLVSKMVNAISLKEILCIAGATVVNDKSEIEKGVDFIDLSPENLDKTTIINLIKSK